MAWIEKRFINIPPFQRIFFDFRILTPKTKIDNGFAEQIFLDTITHLHHNLLACSGIKYSVVFSFFSKKQLLLIQVPESLVFDFVKTYFIEVYPNNKS
ncbi:hypothetical protein BH20BAC1_BH20BAC1_28960 [soil metagenome]